MLKQNLGNKERMVRGGVGLVVLIIAFAAGLPDTASSIVGIVGAVILLTAVLGFCPIYFIINRSSKED
jgi:uncharacterized membrane protein